MSPRNDARIEELCVRLSRRYSRCKHDDFPWLSLKKYTSIIVSHLHLESCLQLLLLTARVVFKGPTMYGTCKARVACFAGNVFFPGDLSFGFGRVHVFSAKNAYPATRCL